MLAGVTVQTDAFNYSRNDDLCDVVTVHVEWTEANGGETLVASLVRQDGYGAVGSTSSGPLGVGPSTMDLAIPLESCMDLEGYYRAKSGWYRVALSDGTNTSLSLPFTITTVSVRQMRDEYCLGLPLTASQTAKILMPPQEITGVFIDRVPENHVLAAYDLVYDYGAQTLSWAGGEGVPVGTRWNRPLVLLGDDRSQYLRVRVNPSQLPSADTTEELIVERDEVTDHDLVRWIWQAERYIQNKTWIPPEIINGATEYVAKEYPQTFYDEGRLPPVEYERIENPSRFLHLTLPLVWLQKLTALEGFFNVDKVVTITDEWKDICERNGVVTLVPRSGATLQWQFYAGFLFNFTLAYQSLPNFWHYSVVYGLPDFHGAQGIVLEAIGKRAAIDMLRQASQAWRPGMASESVSRDGVTQTRTYGRGSGGVFADIIGSYEDWIKYEIDGGRIRNTLVGLKGVNL
jgi:hypothetical protein